MFGSQSADFTNLLRREAHCCPLEHFLGIPTCLFFLDNDTQVLHEATEGLFRVVEVVDLLKSEIFFSLFNASFAYLCNTFATALLTYTGCPNKFLPLDYSTLE